MKMKFIEKKKRLDQIRKMRNFIGTGDIYKEYLNVYENVNKKGIQKCNYKIWRKRNLLPKSAILKFAAENGMKCKVREKGQDYAGCVMLYFDYKKKV